MSVAALCLASLGGHEPSRVESGKSALQAWLCCLTEAVRLEAGVTADDPVHRLCPLSGSCRGQAEFHRKTRFLFRMCFLCFQT